MLSGTKIEEVSRSMKNLVEEKDVSNSMAINPQSHVAKAASGANWKSKLKGVIL